MVIEPGEFVGGIGEERIGQIDLIALHQSFGGTDLGQDIPE
ncbi:MAG: hypothetical protein CM1200mP16_13250 [Nitrospina sp.]|nr:MAG: hypothetical protein CM1200mP16_13250 [Nitrospina sp.]